MPQLIVTETAAQGIEHCRQFLQDKNKLAAKKAAATMIPSNLFCKIT